MRKLIEKGLDALAYAIFFGLLVLVLWYAAPEATPAYARVFQDGVSRLAAMDARPEARP